MQKLREQVKELSTLKGQMAELKKSQDKKIQELEKKLEEQKNQSKEQLWRKTSNFEDEPPWEMTRPSFTPGGNPAIAAPASDAANIAGAGARDNVPLLDTMPKKPGPAKRPTKSFFGPGFEWTTDDGEFLLQVHNETQVDYRGFLDESRTSVAGLPKFPNSGIYIPRERLFFMGRITKPLEYYVSTNAFFGSFNLLDAFLNVRYDNRLMFKFGRFKPPFPYEFFGISNQDLIAPERSLFAVNFGGGRQLAGMLWGELFDKRLDYAVALTDGLRNSYGDFNGGKDVAAFFNYKPFLQTESLDFLRHLNVGGSVMAGQEDNPLVPFGLFTASTFPTGRGSPGVLNASPAFLLFNEGVRERGPRALWSLHLSYFYRGLSLLGGWNSG
ncbi:MAG: hypothetical protein IRY99_14180 [Isosphaeraceae bacterium]|nr:hypothetical protein [Isosphaeraceae bacterium]